jgi:hypothetical protein
MSQQGCSQWPLSFEDSVCITLWSTCDRTRSSHGGLIHESFLFLIWSTGGTRTVPRRRVRVVLPRGPYSHGQCVGLWSSCLHGKSQEKAEEVAFSVNWG